MRRFFEAVVKPLLDMVAPARIVEIGAAEGGNSALVARWCDDRQARLDVIDTAPRFDQIAFEREHNAAKACRPKPGYSPAYPSARCGID